MTRFRIIECPVDAGSRRGGASAGAELLKDILADVLPEAERVVLRREFNTYSLNSLLRHTRRTCLEGAIPIILGGDHLSTLYAAAGAASVFSDLSVLQFDAHHDAYQELPLTHYSFVNVLRRRLPVTQVGVRFEAEKTAHPLVIRAAPTYVSLDVDYFSPELVRSVGHQVPGEMPGRPCAKDFQAALDEVSGPLVALDVCEWFGSQVDSEISELRAALTAFLGRVHGID